MIDELNKAIEAYHAKWHQLIAGRKNSDFFHALVPTSLGWKVKDLADLDRCLSALRDQCDQIHFGWVNDRWLVTLHLRSQPLSCNLTLIKLMQRRPGSDDPVGLDHLDFLLPKDADAKTVLGQEPELKWTEEKNGTHCKWISLWFADTEAKLRSDTVLAVCADEIRDTEQQVLEAL